MRLIRTKQVNMYRCTECQEEFKEKPKYCNCGNDEFVEIPDPVRQTPAHASAIQESSPAKYQLHKLFPLGFFIICIILSISVWFIKLPAEKPQKTQSPQPEQTQNIPSDVASFWNDAKYTPQPAAEIQKPEPQKTQPQAPSKPQTTTQPVAKKQNPAPVKTASQPVQKQTPKPASQTKQTKPATQQQKPAKPLQQPPQLTQTQQKPKLPDSVLNLNKPKTETKAQSQPKPVSKPKPPQMDSAEFLKYKGEIRSALLAKLNVTAIQGTGDCAVEFSLDSTGKLINRNFIYKSSNKTVNDEVYLMLMRLPYYKQPPKYYNGEKIKLKFYFNNGYYEITFI